MPEQEHALADRPLPPLAVPAKLAAINRLAEALVTRGHLPAAAACIANAVTDPSFVRRQLDAPATFRVPVGQLDIIYTRVWSPVVVAYPVNTRVLPALTFRTAGEDGCHPLRPPKAAPENAPELQLSVADADDLLRVLDMEASYLESINPLGSTIAAEGVREPLLLVPLTLQHRDGQEDRTVLAAADGSSRITAVHKLLDLTAEDTVYRLAGNGRLLRQRVTRIVELASKSGIGDLSPEDIARIRAIEIPAALVVGFVPNPDNPGDLAMAIEAKVASIHVAPPKQWSSAAKLDAQLEAAFGALEGSPVTRPELDWLAGYLDPGDAERHGFSRNADIRAAALLNLFVGRRHAHRINRALRDLGLQMPGPQARAELAAEAALRTVRSVLPPAAVDTSRNLLQAAFAMDTLRSVSWSVDYDAHPDELLQDAVDELDQGGPGRAACQLSAMGLFWMAVRNVARRTTRGGDPERRDITSVLALMIHSRHGMEVFRRLVVDGRRGVQPRRVSAGGTALRSRTTQEKLYIDESWLRKTFVGEELTGARRKSPEVQLQERRKKVSEAASELRRAVDALREPERAGGPIVLTSGLPAEYVDGLLASLGDVQAALVHYRYLARERFVE